MFVQPLTGHLLIGLEFDEVCARAILEVLRDSVVEVSEVASIAAYLHLEHMVGRGNLIFVNDWQKWDGVCCDERALLLPST